jgi:hypothetical protein
MPDGQAHIAMEASGGESGEESPLRPGNEDSVKRREGVARYIHAIELRSANRMRRLKAAEARP